MEIQVPMHGWATCFIWAEHCWPQLRASHSGVTTTCGRALLAHWVCLPIDHYGAAIEERAMTAFMSGDLDIELLEISTARTNADVVFGSRNLFSMPVFRRILARWKDLGQERRRKSRRNQPRHV